MSSNEKVHEVQLPGGTEVSITSKDAYQNQLSMDYLTPDKREQIATERAADLRRDMDDFSKHNDSLSDEERGQKEHYLLESATNLAMSDFKDDRVADFTNRVSEEMGRSQIQYEEAVEEMEADGKKLKVTVPPVAETQPTEQPRATESIRKGLFKALLGKR
jgi:hypothetical protein